MGGTNSRERFGDPQLRNHGDTGSPIPFYRLGDIAWKLPCRNQAVGDLIPEIEDEIKCAPTELAASLSELTGAIKSLNGIADVSDRDGRLGSDTA